MVIYGWKNLLDPAALERDALAELVRIYKEANHLATNDPAIRGGAGGTGKKLQAGELETFPSGRNASRFPSVNFRGFA